MNRRNAPKTKMTTTMMTTALALVLGASLGLYSGCTREDENRLAPQTLEQVRQCGALERQGAAPHRRVDLRPNREFWRSRCHRIGWSALGPHGRKPDARLSDGEQRSTTGRWISGRAHGGSNEQPCRSHLQRPSRTGRRSACLRRDAGTGSP